MPSTSVAVDQPGAAGDGTLEIPAERLILRSVSVIETSDATPAGGLSGRVHIVTGTGAENTSLAALASGTISKNSPLTWFGELHLEAGQRIKLFYDFVGAQAIRMSMTVSEN